MAGRGRGAQGRGRPPNDLLGKRNFNETGFPYGNGQKNWERLVKEKQAFSNFKKKDWVDKKAG